MAKDKGKSTTDTPKKQPEKPQRAPSSGGAVPPVEPPSASPGAPDEDPGGDGDKADPQPPASPASRGFDPSKYRLSQDFDQSAGVRKVLTVVPVAKPANTAYVRVRPGEDHRMTAVVLELREQNELYLLDADLAADLLTSEAACRLVMLVTVVTRVGGVSLWPLKLPGPDGKSNPWNDSALAAAKRAETGWVRLKANQQLGLYETWVATGDLPDPVWPGETFAELLEIAFRGKIIESADHPVLRRLRGEV